MHTSQTLVIHLEKTCWFKKSEQLSIRAGVLRISGGAGELQSAKPKKNLEIMFTEHVVQIRSLDASVVSNRRQISLPSEIVRSRLYRHKYTTHHW